MAAAPAATNSLSKSDSLTRTFLVSDLALSSLLALLSFLLELRKEGISINATNSVTFLDGAREANQRRAARGETCERRGVRPTTDCSQSLSLSLSLSLLLLCGTYLRTLDSWLHGTERNEDGRGEEKSGENKADVALQNSFHLYHALVHYRQ